MNEILVWVLISLSGLVAGVLSGVLGFGSSAIMLPIIIYAFGTKAAVPIMAVAALLANCARVTIWFKEIKWRAVFSFSITAVPAAYFGARTLIVLDSAIVDIALGIFFVSVVGFQRILGSKTFHIKNIHLATAGLFLGFLAGVVASTGPINSPFFLWYGLTKGAYIGTEAAASLFVYFTKVSVFSLSKFLSLQHFIYGVLVGISLMIGSYISKFFVQRMDTKWFRLFVEIALVLVGVSMIIKGLWELF
jgi:uncharacterized protein